MSATEASRLLIDVSSLRRSLIGVVLFYFDFAFPAGALRLPAFLLPALRVPFALAAADLVSDGLFLILPG
jgi:hypothetical protein